MAFPADYNRRCELVVQASRIDAPLTGFPVRLVRANLPSELYTTGANSAQADGGDLRFALNADGSGQIPAEVVAFVLDGGAESIEIYVKLDASNTVNTSFYVFYNSGVTETQPAANSTFGSENVWDADHWSGSHFTEDDADTAPQFKDFTGNARHGTAYEDGTAQATAKLAGDGEALDFLNTPSATSAIGNVRIPDIGARSAGMVMAVLTADDVTDQAYVFSHSDYANAARCYLGFLNGAVYVRLGSGAGASRGSITASTKHFVCWRWSGGTGRVHIDGAQAGANYGYTGTPGSTSQSSQWGAYRNETDNNQGQPFDGRMHEGRILSADKGAAWADATFETLLNPGLFVVEGTPEALGGGGPAEIIDIALSSQTVAENSAGATVGTISSTNGGDTYTLISDPTGQLEISGATLRLQAGQSLDRETDGPTFSITIRASNTGVADYDEAFVITVSDVQEPPTGVTLTSTTVPDGSPSGTVVGLLGAVDPDVGETFAFALVAGTGDTDNASFSIVGDELRTGFVADKGTKETYSVRLQATDQGGAGTPVAQAFTITVVSPGGDYRGLGGVVRPVVEVA